MVGWRLLSIAASLLLAAWPAAALPSWSNIAYGPYPGEVLDVCLPAVMPPDAAVILFHGGGWTKGDKSALTYMCKRLSQRGIATFNANYRLVDPADQTTFWPAQLQDAQLLARWVRANAADFSVDPDRLCAAGLSAGGQLAVFLGVTGALAEEFSTDPLGELAIYFGLPSTVRCVVDYFGTVDLPAISDPALLPVVNKMVSRLSGLKLNRKAALQAASPRFFVTPSSPPMLIVQGDEDRTVVGGQQSLPLYNTLVRYGIPATYLSYHGGHSFAGLTQRQIERIVDQAAAFIKAHASYQFFIK